MPANAAAPVTVAGMNLDAGGTAVINDVHTEDVAPGLVHLSYERLDPAGWQQIDVLKAELSDDTVKMKYLTPETVSGTGATVTELVERGGAIAGVNLDRFDINNSWAAAGWGISDGEIIKSGNPNEAEASVGMTAGGLGALVDLVLEGNVTFDDATTARLTTVNTSNVVDGIALYNSQWGSHTRTARWLATPAAGVEVWIGADGGVRSVSDTVGEGPIPEDVQVLVARDGSAEANRLLALRAGDKVGISYGIRDNGLDMAEAGGAWHRLVADGAAIPRSDEHATTLNPRTMIGFSQDKRTAYFVVVDGRQATAAGMQFTQMSKLMLELGAHDAISADGGGSSQMNVREAGSTSTTIANSPSDGYERRDGDGMGLVLARPGSGALAGFDLDPLFDDGNGVRAFPGLSRTVQAAAFDETKSSVSAAVKTWTSGDESIATLSTEGGHGVVRGISEGRTSLSASRDRAVATADLSVIGDLDRLTTDQTTINLETRGSSSIITLTGHDESGFTAPVESRDVKVINPSPGVFSVQPTDDGRFSVTAIGDVGSATLAFEVGEVRTEVAVAVPLELRVIDDFSDISGWATAHDRAATGGIEPGEGHEGSPSIRLNYDFTQSTGTRGRYAVAPGAPGNGATGGIDIPGRPQKLSVWVKGDGNGSLLRLQVMQANGVRNWIDGPGGSQSLHATWTGWQRVDFLVPESFSFPLKLERIRALETVAAKQYRGSLEFSKIYAYLPPEGVQAPTVERAEDPTVVSAGATDDDQVRVAVMSDTQFVAREPNAFQVEGARKALREIVGQKPDVLLINGDLVDEASAADFDLARRVLDEELAGVDFPWHYIPGNHEIMGGPLSNFRDEFGSTNGTIDVEGTRIVMLDSSSGKLMTDFAQVQMLRSQLDAAAADESVSGVLVVSHMPTNDPLPTKGSQLTDRNEAQLLDDWLQEFRADSGKSIASIASHVGAFHTTSVEGVPYVVNGNSGKDPASSPSDGGFTGWTMLGIDPSEGLWEQSDESWLEVETKPRVDENGLTISAPASLGTRESASLSAEFIQDAGHDGRTVPVAWPVSSRWGGSGVHVGDADDAPADAVVAVDPDAGTVTGLRGGIASIEVTVNGRTASASIEVRPELQVEATASTRTLAGKQYVTVVATNRDSVPMEVVISTPFGSKSFATVAPGKSASVSINSRAGSIDAGEATVTFTGVVDGQSRTVVQTASYAARP
ncbi:phosphodiester glycosidase family protein [Microbacterium sp. Gd 4-13]|uniref:phosphodiester glycosidase family protein n=1 Tax=Microbacterium sp. Gd 4-13 TaxID=2173179 RepID=UPI001403C638|nr:phosphodiester glycosidase family protein [Microbacterium sp. Gd 4-13]